MEAPAGPAVTVTFAGSGDAFGSGGRHQACIHLQGQDGPAVLLDCGATSLTALKKLGLNPAGVGTVLMLARPTPPGFETAHDGLAICL